MSLPRTMLRTCRSATMVMTVELQAVALGLLQVDAARCEVQALVAVLLRLLLVVAMAVVLLPAAVVHLALLQLSLLA